MEGRRRIFGKNSGSKRTQVSTQVENRWRQRVFLPIAKNRSFISWEQRSNVEENWLVSKTRFVHSIAFRPLWPDFRFVIWTSDHRDRSLSRSHLGYRFTDSNLQKKKKSRSKHVASSDRNGTLYAQLDRFARRLFSSGSTHEIIGRLLVCSNKNTHFFFLAQ